MWELIRYLLIGIIQGVSEVLPISSSAHLVIIQEVMGVNDDNLTLEVFLHLASLVAVIFFLRKKIVRLINGVFRYIFKGEKSFVTEFKIVIFLIVSTIPIVIMTILFKDQINTISNSILIIGFLLIINGILLLSINGIKGNKNLKTMKLKDALVIGIFQCMGLFAGISRSGSCIYGSSFTKMEKEASAEYAFLLFIPAVLGATVLEVKNLKYMIVGSDIWIYLITFIVTSIVTYLSLNWLLKIIKRGKLKYFGYYCIGLGMISVLIMMTK